MPGQWERVGATFHPTRGAAGRRKTSGSTHETESLPKAILHRHFNQQLYYLNILSLPVVVHNLNLTSSKVWEWKLSEPGKQQRKLHPSKSWSSSFSQMLTDKCKLHWTVNPQWQRFPYYGLENGPTRTLTHGHKCKQSNREVKPRKKALQVSNLNLKSKSSSTTCLYRQDPFHRETQSRAKHTGYARKQPVHFYLHIYIHLTVESLQMQDTEQHTVPQADLKGSLYALERTSRIHLTAQNLVLAYMRQDL